MRASGASELRKFSHFYILKLLFLSIFCWYFRYFVGTNDMLVGLHHVYRQNPEKAWSGQLPPAPPPPPPLATLMYTQNVFFQITQVPFARHNRFRYVKLNFKYARASGASERSETSCIFVFGECTTNTGNPR